MLHHRKKLNGRRLDYDYKRGKLKANSKGVTEDEVNQSYEKLEESIQMAGTSMHNLLSNDVEQVAQLSQFVEAMIRFHREVCLHAFREKNQIYDFSALKVWSQLCVNLNNNNHHCRLGLINQWQILQLNVIQC